MRVLRPTIFFAGATAVVVACAISRSSAPAAPIGTGVIRGLVSDANGPVVYATVRVQATNNSTHTAADGSFTLTGLTPYGRGRFRHRHSEASLHDRQLGLHVVL
jgi:hypothetical protein